MRKGVLLLVLLSAVVAIVASDCGCGTKCFAYSDPSRCTRCCTATVKRSLRIGPDGQPLRGRTFLAPSSSSSGGGYNRPLWQQRLGNDRFLKKLSDILRFMNPSVL